MRDHAMKLAVEIGRWLGKDIILSRLKLRSAQMKDLEDALAALPSSPATPERYLRSQQEQQFVQASNGSGTGGTALSMESLLFMPVQAGWVVKKSMNLKQWTHTTCWRP